MASSAGCECLGADAAPASTRCNYHPLLPLPPLLTDRGCRRPFVYKRKTYYDCTPEPDARCPTSANDLETVK